MDKIVNKIASLAMAATMAFVGLPSMVYASSNENILKYNKGQIDTVDESFKKGFNITNDYAKIKYIKTSAWNITQPNRIVEQGGLDELPDGIFVPEVISDNLNFASMDFGYRIFSLGVTGTEIETHKKNIDKILEGDQTDEYSNDASQVYGSLTYPLGDMFVDGDSTSTYKSSSDELSQKGINIKASLKQYVDAGRVNYTGDSHHSKSNLMNDLICEIKLPKGVSIKSSSGELKNNINVKGNFYSIKEASLNGNIIKIHLNNVMNEVVTYKLEPLNDNDLDIEMNVSGVYYSDMARLADDYTIEGYVSGYTATGKNSNYNPRVQGVAFDYSIYSIKQDPTTKDKAHDLGGLMSLTIGLKSNTVTFKIDGQPDKPVLVETGKTINGDIDKTQSMPQDPTKTGYTFKGWYTEQNGKGKKFDGDTSVDRDMPVYAYFEKKADKPNKPNKPYKPGTNPNKPDPGRIDGNDRIDTAINISKKYYDRAKTVIVVRHDLFPDSMTASVLAKLKDAPILLNPTAKLDPRVGAEIKRLGAEEVIIVGGQNSVSEKVREELKAYDVDKNVERISGVDRYGTSEMVARRVAGIAGKKKSAVVASGQVFPDALSVGTFASREAYPILLVKKDSVPAQITKAIKDLDINKTYIAGGLNTISKATEAKLPVVLERMAGQTRYETSVAIAKSKFKDSKEAFVASGEEFADALVISPISGKYNRPTLLVSRKASNNAPVKAYVKDSRLTSITAIGGQKYIPYSVLEDLVK